MNPLHIGRGCQVAGVVLILTAIFLLGDMLTKLPRDWPRAQRITCVNNLKQIGLATRTWAIDHDGPFPFKVSTNAGGTMEFCATGGDGFDSNAALHFQVMSNELSTPLILVCPQDRSRKPAARFSSLQASNVTYRLRSGTNINESVPAEMLASCPVHGNILLCDGSVVGVRPDPRAAWNDWIDLMRYNIQSWFSPVGLEVMVIGLVLLWAGSRLTSEAKGGRRSLGLIIGEALLLILAMLLIGLMLIGTAHF
jgi:hypothetical protein